MDANGTRYYLYLGRDDWAACLGPDGRTPLGASWDDRAPSAPAPGLAWNSERGELTLEPRLFQFVAAPRDTPPAIEQRRGAARDRYGNWYWVADDGLSVRVASSGDGRTSAFWPPAGEPDCPPAPRYGDFAPLEPGAASARLPLAGLAVTEDHYLVVGVRAPAGLLVFDLFAGGEPRQLLWPAGVPFDPFDMAARPVGGVWVLDRAHRRLWALDRYLQVVRHGQAELTLAPAAEDDFQPLGGEPRALPALTFPAGVSIDAASPLDLADPLAVECLPDDTALVLDGDPAAPFAQIYPFSLSAPPGPALSTEGMAALIEPSKAGAFALRGYDLAFVPGRVGRPDGALLGQLFVAAAEGNQSFAFDLVEASGALRLEALPRYLPMRLFGGKGLVAGDNKPYYDFGDAWLPLVEQRRPRYAEEAALRTPVAAGGPLLDSREPGCVWHRLMLDACIPPAAAVLVRSRAAESLAELADAPWRDEPRPYRRADGSEQPYANTGPYDTWELLLQAARGRFLQLELTLRGNGQATPRVRAMRAYYPRFSYLRYLPAVYSEEPTSASFLDRFLANLEGFYTTLEDKIAAAQVLFDVQTAPPDALDWLAGWLGVALDPAWDEARRRLFIRHAPLFFRRRGTVGGLLMALRLVVEPCVDDSIFADPEAPRFGSIRIVERFRARRTPGVALGDPSEPAGPLLFDPAQRWSPALGGDNLQQRYMAFVTEAGLEAALPTRFAPAAPAANAADWERFARAALGFVPSAAAGDAALWRDYLARHYRRICALSDAYRLVGAARYNSFEDVPMPAQLPPDGAPLQDWYQFQGVTLPTARAAHRFTVLLPMPPGGYAPQRERLELARRVLELEKPAHTTFDLKFYWALFRLGEVRLGYDTLLDKGGRSPELMAPMVLGQGHLVETYLAAGRVAPESRYARAGGEQ